jgi:trehalose 6-phosphate synthase
MSQQRLVIVSNRLPIAIDQDEAGHWSLSKGSGGLITALAPLMQDQQGIWVGWPGCGPEAPVDRLLQDFSSENGYQMVTVPLEEQEIEKYYHGFANETLWPLFHDLLGHCHFNFSHYQTYQEVNRKFATTVARASQATDLLWIQDYQLISVGAWLRRQQCRNTLAFFLHIPFPQPDLLRRLPWKNQILKDLLAYDLIGFQTRRDQRNFIHCITSLTDRAKVVSRHRNHSVLRYGERLIKVGHFPISIDFNNFADHAQSQEVADAAWYLHEHYEGMQLMLGIDRLDYTKGIPERFLAFERALEKYPEMQQQVALLQVVVPSRTRVPEYQELRQQLEQLAGRINGRYAEAGWTPVNYFFRSLDKTQLLAHYRSAEIALITPLRDGMNLVAKEYCASSVDNQGVLLLSEFAGAADQLGKHALLVNPYDVEGTADAMFQAFTMEEQERRQRMIRLRNNVRRLDVHRWLRNFLKTLGIRTPE